MSQWSVVCRSQENQSPVLSQVSETLSKTIPSGPVEILMRRPKRSLDQNALMWPLLKDFSEQVEHFGNKYTQEQWKDLLTAGFVGCVDYAPSLDGKGLVAFGVRTSEWPKDTFSQFIEFMYAEGSERGVKWSEKSEQTIGEVKG